jgi:hypothetical protein
MTHLKQQNPRINALIPNVMNQHFENDKQKSMNNSPLRGGNQIL